MQNRVQPPARPGVSTNTRVVVHLPACHYRGCCNVADPKSPLFLCDHHERQFDAIFDLAEGYRTKLLEDFWFMLKAQYIR